MAHEDDLKEDPYTAPAPPDTGEGDGGGEGEGEDDAASWYEPLLGLKPEEYPDVSGLITEDDEPVESIVVEKQYHLMTDLATTWSDREGFPEMVAMANVGLFPRANNPPLVPDFLLSRDVQFTEDFFTEKYRSYFTWVFGKPPDVVGEFVSDRRGDEGSLKKAAYARMKVPYYVIYDPRGKLGQGLLRVYEFDENANVYRLLPGEPPTWMPRAGLGLTLWHGTYSGITRQWLRWCDAQGKVIPTGVELAEQERQRADDEKRRADDEKRRADDEKRRADDEKRRADDEKRRADEATRLVEKEKRQAQSQKRRAEKEKSRAEEAARLADNEKQRADNATRQTREEQRRADDEKRRADELDRRLRQVQERMRALGVEPGEPEV